MSPNQWPDFYLQKVQKPAYIFLQDNASPHSEDAATALPCRQRVSEWLAGLYAVQIFHLLKMYSVFEKDN